MATRNGKIANLPNDIREQLNLRLLEGETGKELAAWLNTLPDVQSILGSQFNGSHVSEVNLTHWRQGGYLQWLTERECFDSARTLADLDGDMTKTGLSAERLFSILTLRYGQLLIRWDSSPEEGVSKIAGFSEMAKKARILQAITRSALAIHRIQSQSACSKVERGSASPNSPTATVPDFHLPSLRPSKSKGASEAPLQPIPESIRQATARLAASARATGKLQANAGGAEVVEGKKATLEPDLEADARRAFRAALAGAGPRPEILSGPISAPSIISGPPWTPCRAGRDLAEVLNAA
jgi:hypothetical protein